MGLHPQREKSIYQALQIDAITRLGIFILAKSGVGGGRQSFIRSQIVFTF